MKNEEIKAKIEALSEIKIHEAKKMEYTEPFLPLGSRLYDKGLATLADGRKVMIAWGGDVSLNMNSVKAIHTIDPEREFCRLSAGGWIAMILKESEQ